MWIMVLFVCTGNICRSPAAHGVLKAMLEQQGRRDVIVDSAGLGSWHIGETPDHRAVTAAQKYGFDISSLKARQFQKQDFYRFYHIIAMDQSHYSHLMQCKPKDAKSHVSYFCDWFRDEKGLAIEDPYYSGPHMFDKMMQDIMEGCQKIMQNMVK